MMSAGTRRVSTWSEVVGAEDVKILLFIVQGSFHL